MKTDSEDRKEIPSHKCFNGSIYELCACHMYFGVFRRSTMSFIGIGFKPGERTIKEEYHCDQKAPKGTAAPRLFLGRCPVYSILNDDDDWYSSLILFSYLTFLETMHYYYGDVDIIKLFTGSDLDIKPWIDQKAETGI